MRTSNWIAGLTMLMTSLLNLGCGIPIESGNRIAATKDERQQGSHDPAMTFERMSPLVEVYKEVGAILQLDDAEQKQIDEVLQKHQAIFENWYGNEWQELRKHQQAATNAAQKRDLASLQQLKANGGKERVAELHQQERQMQVNFETELLASIPSDKLEQWKSHRIATLLLTFLEPLNLSPQQIKEVRQQAPAVIRSMEKPNWQGYGTDRLEKKFASTILKPNQRKDFEQLQKKNRLRMLRWNNYQ